MTKLAIVTISIVAWMLPAHAAEILANPNCGGGYLGCISISGVIGPDDWLEFAGATEVLPKPVWDGKAFRGQGLVYLNSRAAA